MAKRTGAKGKYTPARVDAICRIIARTGCAKEAYTAAGIHPSTYHDWLNKKPEFSEKVARAWERWYAIDDEAIAAAFRERLIVAMQGATEEWTSEEETTLPNGEKVTKTSKKTVRRGPAEWAFRIVAPQVGGNFGVERKASEAGGDSGAEWLEAFRQSKAENGEV